MKVLVHDGIGVWQAARRLNQGRFIWTAGITPTEPLSRAQFDVAALTRFLDDADLTIDYNWVENRVRPIALGRNNWLFAGPLRAGKRAAAVMSLIHSARLNGHDPYVYLRDVMDRLPTQVANRVDELLPHLWRPAATA